LTEAGTGQYYDERLNSLRSAVDVANRCGCLGIVSASDPIIEAPGLIEKIRKSGLLLFTYGSKNNILENVKIQTRYGADAIICDKVRQIYSGIRE
jgi:glycerophosphodiester phosphodiesterase